MENNKKEPNRKRSVVIRFHVTEDEKTLILGKKRYCGFRSLERVHIKGNLRLLGKFCRILC